MDVTIHAPEHVDGGATVELALIGAGFDVNAQRFHLAPGEDSRMSVHADGSDVTVVSPGTVTPLVTVGIVPDEEPAREPDQPIVAGMRRPSCRCARTASPSRRSSAFAEADAKLELRTGTTGRLDLQLDRSVGGRMVSIAARNLRVGATDRVVVDVNAWTGADQWTGSVVHEDGSETPIELTAASASAPRLACTAAGSHAISSNLASGPRWDHWASSPMIAISSALTTSGGVEPDENGGILGRSVPTSPPKPGGMSHLAALIHKMTGRWDIQERLHAVMRGQHGLVSRRQAMALGLTRRMIDGRLGSGAWILAAPGVYRAAAVAPTFRQHCLTGALWGAPEGLVSREAAGALWRYETVSRPSVINLTFPAIGREAPDGFGLRVHWTNDLLDEDRAELDGIAVTAALRTALDLAWGRSDLAFELILEDALRRRLSRLRNWLIERTATAVAASTVRLGSAGCSPLACQSRRTPVGSCGWPEC